MKLIMTWKNESGCKLDEVVIKEGKPGEIPDDIKHVVADYLDNKFDGRLYAGDTLEFRLERGYTKNED